MEQSQTNNLRGDRDMKERKTKKQSGDRNERTKYK
jgi:hypothetical protein